MIAQALESAERRPFRPNVPFEILWGAEDAITAPPKETTLAMLRVIDGVGHMPHIEAASEVVSAVRRPFHRIDLAHARSRDIKACKAIETGANTGLRTIIKR